MVLLSVRVFRVDGAFEPWKSKLTEALCELLSLSTEPNALGSNDGPPPARVKITDNLTDVGRSQNDLDPLLKDECYHLATLTCNDRTTAEGWYQDVRHVEFDFDETIQ